VAIDLVGNDTDANGDLDPTTDAVESGPQHGSVTVDPNTGTATYSPDPDFHGVDSFTYRVCDASGACDSAVVAVSVTAVNDAPSAVDDSGRTDAGVPVSVTVLGNDTDGDGDPLSVSGTSDPTNGSVVVNPDGTIRYTPDAGFSGTDSFTYTINDGRGGQDTATVTITVDPAAQPNTAPNALDDRVEVPRGKDQIIIDVLDNDDIPSNSSVVITITDEPTHGEVLVNADGTITYTVTGDGDTDQFTYQVCDGGGSCSSAVVSVTLPGSASSGPGEEGAEGPWSKTPVSPGEGPALAFTGAIVPVWTVAAFAVGLLAMGVGLVLAARRTARAA
jgi:hypothetical protein